LSLSYLPAANRLGVVVMKARGLQSDKMKDNIGIYHKHNVTQISANNKINSKSTIKTEVEKRFSSSIIIYLAIFG